MLTNARAQLVMEVGDPAEAEAVWASQSSGPKQMQAIVGAFRDRNSELSLALGRSAQIPAQYSSLAVWIELSQLLRENEQLIGRLWLRKIDISTTSRDQSVRISGVVTDPSRYNEMVDLLNACGLFTEVQTGDVSASKNSEFWDFGDTTLVINVDELERRRERDLEEALS